MPFFDKIFDKLFSKSQQKPSAEPFVREPISRTEEAKRSYFAWQNSGEYKEVLKEIWLAYHLKKNNQPDDWQVHLLQMPYANGFALTYRNDVAPRDFEHLFDLFKDKVLNLGYRQANADRSIFDRGDYVETKEKYYLKPAIETEIGSSLFNQRYGNILIELVWIDRVPSYMKFVANIYSDRLYTKALDFSELMEELFEEAISE